MLRRTQKIRIVGILLLIGIYLTAFGTGRKETIPGQNYQGQQGGSDGTVQYQFQNNINVNIHSNANISVGITVDPLLINRTAELTMNCSETSIMNTLQLTMNQSFFVTPGNSLQQYRGSGSNENDQGNTGGSNQPHQSESRVAIIPTATESSAEEYIDVIFTYETYYTIAYTANISSLILSVPLGAESGLDPQQIYSWIVFDPTTESWFIVNSSQTETTLLVDLTALSAELSTITLTIVSLHPSLIPFWETSWGITILILGAIAIVFGLLMSKTEYRSYLLNRSMPLETGPHRLSMEEILENENRLVIIDKILEQPGIHFNALLREMGISAGNLAWHLDLLETFKVIRKERVGQYLLYYPYLEKNPISRLDPKLQKSKTTLEILQLIDDNPGIYQNQLAKRLSLDHKTVKYHLDKLLENEVIYWKKEKGNKGFYPHDWPIEEKEENI